MKVFFKMFKIFLELLAWVTSTLFFNAVDAIVFSGTTMSLFEIFKTGIFMVAYFSLKALVEYMEKEWDFVDSEEYKRLKAKKAKKAKRTIVKKTRVRKIKSKKFLNKKL